MLPIEKLIYKYVKNNPGATATQIREALFKRHLNNEFIELRVKNALNSLVEQGLLTRIDVQNNSLFMDSNVSIDFDVQNNKPIILIDGKVKCAVALGVGIKIVKGH